MSDVTSDSDSNNRLLIQNTASQWEQETKSRKANLIELVLAQGLLQLVMWAVWFPNLLAGNNIGVDVAYGLLALLGIFVLLLSPFRHRDTLKGWGIGDARYVINRLRNGGTRTRVFFISIIAILIVIAIVAFELLFPKIFHFMGVNESAAAAFQATPPGGVVVVVLAVVIALFLGIVVIRYDNFLNALKMAFVVIVILGIPLLLLALVVNPNVLSTIDPGNFAIGFAGYIFWGALQQLLFASYFGTRFRKAFSPSIQIAEPATAKREEEKALYKKRIVVSLLNGSFFGLIHIPSWTLMAFTMILGFFISWLYMKDGNRNLIAIGVIHGFLGTMASQFFSHNVVNLSVGPSSVPVAVVPWMWLVEIFVGLLLVAIVLIWRKYEMKPAPA